MDLAVGARRIWVVMEHTTKKGAPKLVDVCGYPLTAKGVVSRIYTDLAVIEVHDNRFHVIEVVNGLSRTELQERSDAQLVFE